MTFKLIIIFLFLLNAFNYFEKKNANAEFNLSFNLYNTKIFFIKCLILQNTITKFTIERKC